MKTQCNLTLCRLLFVTVVFALMPALACAQPVSSPIEVMDQGACWIQKRELEGKIMNYQIASFGSGQSFQIVADEFSGGTLRSWIQTQLKSRFPSLPALKYEVGFYCFSSGHFVSIQVDRPGAQPLCLQAKASLGNGTNDLELLALRPDQSFIPGATCAGIEERSLGLSLKSTSEASVDRIRAAIANNRTLADIVESIDYRPGSFFAMARLKSHYVFREVEAQAQLVTSPLVMEEVSTVWLNSISSIAGEERVLFDGVTESY